MDDILKLQEQGVPSTLKYERKEEKQAIIMYFSILLLELGNNFSTENKWMNLPADNIQVLFNFC